MRIAASCCLALAIGLLASPAGAQLRHAGAHVHGLATLTLVAEGAELSLALAVPAADLVGFERAPANAEEERRIDAARQVLSEPLALFSFGAADCTVTGTHVSFGDEAAEEHDHAHEPGAEHADFEAEYLLTCQAPLAPLTLGTQFFARFPGTRAIEVEALIGGKAVKARLAPGAPSALLQ